MLRILNYLLSFFCIVSCTCCGMEQQLCGNDPASHTRSVALVAKLKKDVGNFESALGSILLEPDNNYIAGAKKHAKSISDNISQFSPTVSQEIEARKEKCIPSQVHTELNALLNWIGGSLFVRKNSSAFDQLKKTVQQPAIAQEDKDLAVAEFYEKQLKTLDIIEKLFCLAQDSPTAYRLCGKSNAISVINQALHDSVQLDKIAETCYKRWYDKDGFGRNLHNQIDEELAKLERALRAHYQNASSYYQQLMESHNKLKDEKLKKYKDDECYKKDKEEIDKKMAQHKIDLDRYEKAWDGEYERSATCYSHDNLSVQEEELNEGFKSERGDSGDDSVISGVDQQDIPRCVKMVPQKVSRAITNALTAVPCLFKKVVKVAIAIQCFDDFYSQLIAASNNPDFILSDLAARLKTDDAASENLDEQSRDIKPDKAIEGGRSIENKPVAGGLKSFLANAGDVSHDGFVAAHYAGCYAREVPEDLEVVCSTVERIALTIKSLAEIGAGKRTGAESFFARMGKRAAGVILDKETTDNIFSAAFNVDDVGNKLRTYIVPMVTNLLNNLRRDFCDHQHSIIKFDALTRLLKIYSLKDSRARYIGKRDEQFRKWFDQLGKTWNNPDEEEKRAMKNLGRSGHTERSSESETTSDSDLSSDKYLEPLIECQEPLILDED